jgi:hypothetical protein
MFTTNAQDREDREFGVVDVRDSNVSSYPKDPEAAGVVLYEKGRNYWRLIDNKYIRLIKEVHVRMKVFDASRFDQATVYIPYYRGKDADEVINKFKAVTHNGELKNYVGESAMFNTDETANWSVKRFTFPNVQDGSILEYTYQIESPFFFNFGSWKFQGDLPKLYTEFSSEIPGNYVYNRSLIGTETLDINEVSLKKDCFWLPGHKINADCEVAIYAMTDVPAFKEEPYMLSKENYISQIEFELSEYTDFYGILTKYARDWDDADKEFRTNKELGKQLKLNYYFKDVIPESMANMTDQLEKAKAIYSFVQNHYTWNGRSPFFGDVDLKEAFESKTGNVSEINLALINTLEAAGIDTKLVILSTRDNGLPRQNYPVITDFNYAAALVKIGDQEFLLDATDKYLPFGMLPPRALNIQGRVMDFKEGSYWYPLTPETRNVHYVNARIELQEDGSFKGKVGEVNTGYLGSHRRKVLDTISTANYISEKQHNKPRLEISPIDIKDRDNYDKPVTESYDVTILSEQLGDLFYLNPFILNKFFDVNPFKLDERNYPVDFGYPMSNTFILSIETGNTMEVSELPENRAFKLAGEAGECTVIYSSTPGKINLRYSLKLNDYRFGPEMYQDLKRFFTSISDIQNNEAILLKKI